MKESKNILLYNLNGIEIIESTGVNILIVLSGNIDVRTDRGDINLSSGETYILNDMEICLLYPSYLVNNLLIKINFPEELLKEYGGPIKFHNFIEKDRIDPSFYSDSINLLESNSLKENDYYLRKLLDYLISNEYAFKEYIEDSLAYRKIKRLYNESILKNILEYENMHDIAKELNISYPYLSINFREITGVSLSHYKQMKNLYEASKMLVETNYSLEEITYKIGYVSTKSIYDIFSKNLEIYPLEYRDKYRLKQVKQDNQLTDSKDYIYFKNFYKTFFYSDLYDLYDSVYYNNILKNKVKKGIDVYYFELFERNYIPLIKTIHNELGINYIEIDILISDSDYYIKGIEDPKKFYDIFNLLDLLNQLEIKVGLSVNILGKEDTHKYSKSEIRRIEKFLRDLKEALTKTVCSSYDWIILLNDLSHEDYFKQMLDLYRQEFGRNIKTVLHITNITYTSFMESFEYIRFKFPSDKLILSLIYDKVYEYHVSNYESESCGKGSVKEFLIRDIDEFMKINEKYPSIKIGKVELHYNNGEDIIYKDNIDLYEDIKLAYIYLDFIVQTGYYEMIYFKFYNVNNSNVRRSRLVRDNKFTTAFYHMLKLTKIFKNKIVVKGNGYVHTKKDDDHHFILYNNFLIDGFYSKNRELYDTSNASRVIELDSCAIEGKYKVVERIIGPFNANLIYIINDFDTDYLLNQEEMNYINRVNTPRVKVRVIDTKKDNKLKITIKPYEIIQVSYYKLK